MDNLRKFVNVIKLNMEKQYAMEQKKEKSVAAAAIKTNAISINSLILNLKEDLNDENISLRLRQDIEEALKIIEPMKVSYYQCRGYLNGHCKATANQLPCKCNGNKQNCDFYKMQENSLN